MKTADSRQKYRNQRGAPQITIRAGAGKFPNLLAKRKGIATARIRKNQAFGSNYGNSPHKSKLNKLAIRPWFSRLSRAVGPIKSGTKKARAKGAGFSVEYID